MHKIILSLFLISICFSQSQYNKVISPYYSTVPIGKIWTLSCNDQIKIQLHPGSLESGTLCNAILQYCPGIVSFVAVMDTNKQESMYRIAINGLSKVPYTNYVTYSISPIAIIKSSLDLDDFFSENRDCIARKSKIVELGMNELVLTEGMRIHVASCISSIEVVESDVPKPEPPEKKTKIAPRKKAKVK